MRKRSNGKKILALLCALCMVAGTIQVSGLKKVDASDVPESMDASLTPITFGDFNISDGTYSKIQKGGTYQAADTLDGMVFQGYVTFPKRVSGDGERIYLGGNSTYNPHGTSGISLRNVANSDTALMVFFNKTEGDSVNPDGHTSTYYIESSYAGTTLINHEFYLQVSIQVVDKDSDGAKDDVKVGLWFNGTLFKNEYLYFSDCAEYLGNMMQVFALREDQPVTVSSRVIQKAEEIEDEEQESSVVPITFSDFGVDDGSYNKDGSNGATIYTSGGIGTYKAADTLDGTVFNGKVTFPENTDSKDLGWINIGGLASEKWGNLGLRITNISNNNYAWGLTFYKSSASDKTATQYIDLSTSEDKITLNGVEVQLQLAFEIVDSDNDGNKDDVKLSVGINDTYNTELYFAECAEYLGNMIQVYALPDYSTQVKSIAAPASLPEVTYGEIGIADGFYGATNSSEKGTGSFAELTPSSLDGKVFKGTVTFPKRSEGKGYIIIGGRYADDPYGNTGIQIHNNSSENAWSVTFWKKNSEGVRIETEPDSGGKWIDLTLNGVKLNGAEVQLQLTFEIVDSDGDGNKDDVKIGVFINDSDSCRREFTFADCAAYLGNMIQVYAESSTSFAVESSELSKADGTEVTFADFGIADGSYNAEGSNGATMYSEGGIGEYKVTAADKVLKGCVTFPKEQEAYIQIADLIKISNKDAYHSGRLTLDLNGTEYSLKPETAGVELVDTTVKLEVSIEAVARGTDSICNDLQIGVTINDRLYNNDYWYLENKLSELGTQVKVSAPTNSFVKIGKEDYTEYCNLYEYESGYALTVDSNVTVNQKETSAMTAGTTLAIAGDYRVQHWNGICEVIVWNYGQAHPDDVIDVRDLAAVKKAELGTEPSTKSGRLGADVNADDSIDDKDTACMRKYILGTYTPNPGTAQTHAISYAENVMPIAGYYGPLTHTTADKNGNTYDYVTDEIYKKIKELGINLIIANNYSYSDTPATQEMVKKNLRLAEKYQLGVYLSDSRMAKAEDKKKILGYMSGYSGYFSFRGISVVDEPVMKNDTVSFPSNASEDTLSKYSLMAAALNSCSNTIGYANLFPLWDQGVYSSETAYRAYIDEYVTAYQAKQLSFDYYVYDEGEYTSKNGYFNNLSVIREKAQEYNLPFWTFIQAGSNWNGLGTNETHPDMTPTDNTTPTKGEVLWNVNTSLAYGTKGIEYFPLIQPYYFAYTADGTYDYERNGMIGANGETNVWYAYAQEANRQIAAVDEVLLNSVSKKILAVGTAAQTDTGLSDTAYGKLASVASGTADQGVLVGVFEYSGKEAFYVVNYDTDNAQSITLNFTAESNFRLVSAAQNEAKSGTACTFALEAGDAILVVMN